MIFLRRQLLNGGSVRGDIAGDIGPFMTPQQERPHGQSKQDDREQDDANDAHQQDVDGFAEDMRRLRVNPQWP